MLSIDWMIRQQFKTFELYITNNKFDEAKNKVFIICVLCTCAGLWIMDVVRILSESIFLMVKLYQYVLLLFYWNFGK